MRSWIRKLLGQEEIPVTVTRKSKIQIEPDPDMAPGEWSWKCLDCDAGNTGMDQEIRAESFQHCLEFGHSVSGNAHG